MIVRALVVALFALGAGAAPATALESPWSTVPNAARARLVAGTAESGGTTRTFAAVEIELQKGWKTYWRHPGDAGGLPPSFDVSKSVNVASAEVLYPAPQRFTDKSGHTIGYKDAVAFPVRLTPADPAKPMNVVLGLGYGLCKDVCIPAEAEFSLEVPASGAGPLPLLAAAALDHAPVPAGDATPRLVNVRSALSDAAPKIVLETVFPGDGAGADVFVEAPDGLFVPVPEKTGGTGGALTFEIDLSDGADAVALAGKTLTATLVSAAGQSVETFTLK